MLVERTIQNHTLRAECSKAHSHMAASMLDVFESQAASGMPLELGTQIRFGWSLLRLVEDSDALRVAEPDFAIWPEQRWNPTIDTTLTVLATQTSLLHRLGVDGEDAYFDQLMITAPGALAQPKIFLRRASSISAEDSGWLLGTLDNPEALTRDDSLETVLIASLVARRPVVLQALALPLGFVAIFSGDILEQVFDSAGRARFLNTIEGNKSPNVQHLPDCAQWQPKPPGP